MNAPANALFLFAHQDDEYAAVPWIREELRGGARVACLYLTDGSGNAAPEVRDAESSAVLYDLDVDLHNVAFLDAPGGRITDGALAQRCEDGLSAVESWLTAHDFAPARIYAPAWEGGHPDHDAAHLIAAAIASDRGILDEAWQFSLYNAYRKRRPLFATMRQIPRDAPSRRASMPMGARWWATMLCWRYPSQRRTWMGLFPGALIERGILARESVVRFDLARLAMRPHDGELLYERMFGTTYEEFSERTRGLREPLTHDA